MLVQTTDFNRVEALIDALEKEGLVKLVTPGNGSTPQAVPPPATRPTSRTLTNSLETSSDPEPDLATLSHEERIRRIAAKAAAGLYKQQK